jgi:hypothetical protein
MSVLPANADTHEHKHESHHEEKQQTIKLNKGSKWQIDSSLHIGMSNIKTSIENNITEIHHKKFTREQYTGLSVEINSHLSYLFKHCKLPKDADAQLHVLLFKVMQGNEQMQSATNQRSGAIKIIKALQQYPQYFDDKNWQALQH